MLPRTAAGLLALNVLLVCATAATTPKDPHLTDALLQLILKKDYDGFLKELAKDGMDVNQPDATGRLALMEAVKNGEFKFVDALIQFGAKANSTDPATLNAPIQQAFMLGRPQIARLLLKYGADINTKDKSGKKPREYAPSKDISDLIIAYDKNGSLAFEDAPGSWIKTKNDQGDTYWYNSKSQESRWDTPPSCAWRRVVVEGAPDQFANSVTGQRTYKLPKPLAWRLIVKDGKEMWYNWAIDVSQYEVPDEVPDELLQEARALKNVRWYNAATKAFSWEDPKFRSAWRAVQAPPADGKGAPRTYYLNIETSQTTWDMPDDLAWQQVPTTTGDGKPYWYNAKTGESTWDAPASHQWERHDTDL